MLNKIKIQNFQAHKKLIVELDPRVTTIVGSSDTGKSAVIRALRWLCQNSPSGEAFIREGSEGCTVTLEFDDHRISRRKGKGTNEYVVDGETLKSFGSSVPEPASKLLNVSPLNFQQQHDPPFWFSDSAGQVSKNLNSIVDLELIDESLSRINKKVSKSQTEEEICKTRLEAAREKKKSLEWVKEATSEYFHLDEFESFLEIDRSTQKELIDTLSQTTHLLEQRERVSALIEPLTQCLTQGDNLNKAATKADHLKILLSEIRKLSSIKAPNISDLGSVARLCKEGTKNLDQLKDILDRIQSESTALSEYRMKLEKAKTDLTEKTEGKCPICGGSL